MRVASAPTAAPAASRGSRTPACWPSSTARMSRRDIPRPRSRATSTARTCRSQVTCRTTPASSSRAAAGTMSRSAAGSPALSGPPMRRAVSASRVATVPRCRAVARSAAPGPAGWPTHQASTGNVRSPVTARARDSVSRSARTATAPGADGTVGTTSVTTTGTGVMPTVTLSWLPLSAPTSLAKRAETATGTGPGSGKAVATRVRAASSAPPSSTVAAIRSAVPVGVADTPTVRSLNLLGIGGAGRGGPDPIRQWASPPIRRAAR